MILPSADTDICCPALPKPSSRRVRTALPLASATVIAPSAAEADALATAFYIKGSDAARRYCTAHPNVGAILLPEGHKARPLVIGPAAGSVELA